jgi:hypothetical protein
VNDPCLIDILALTTLSPAKQAIAQSTTVTDRVMFRTSALAEGIPGTATAFNGTRMTRHNATRFCLPTIFSGPNLSLIGTTRRTQQWFSSRKGAYSAAAGLAADAPR